MEYISFEISNFKGIRHLFLDLSKFPNVDIFTLVGINESGKTTILEAIDFFQRDVYEDTNKHKLIPKNLKTNFNEKVSVSAKLKLNDSDKKKLRRYVEAQGYKLVTDINEIEITKKYEFEKSKYIENGTLWSIDMKCTKGRGKTVKDMIKHNKPDWDIVINKIRDKLLPRIIYYPNFLFEFPEKIYLEDHSSFNSKKKEKQEFYKDVIQDILSSIESGLTIEDIINRSKSSDDEDKESLDAAIEAMSNKVSETILKAWEKLFDASNKEIILSCGIDEVGAENTSIVYIQMKLKEGRNKYSIDERSLGFRWFFSFLLLTEFRKTRKNENGKTLFLLDEPASNLHSTAQKKLLSTFDKIANSKDPDRACQMIYTTHSHHLINPKWLAGTFIVKNKASEPGKDFDTSNTDITTDLYKNFVANHPNQRSYFQPVLDAVEYQPSLIENVPKIVILEGKNDYYTFKYLQDNILPKKYSKLNFYPGGGCGANSPIIALYLAWGRDFLVLLDGDTAGRKAKKKYMTDFGEILGEKITTFVEIEASYKCPIESLFDKDDRLKITKMFDSKLTAYNKSKFNSVIQQLYIDDKKISLNKDTLANFKRVFDFLEKKMR